VVSPKLQYAPDRDQNTIYYINVYTPEYIYMTVTVIIIIVIGGRMDLRWQRRLFRINQFAGNWLVTRTDRE